jgi:hypothetical protein
VVCVTGTIGGELAFKDRALDVVVDQFALMATDDWTPLPHPRRRPHVGSPA